MSRILLQQALDALNMACAKYGDVGNIHTDWGKWDAAGTALRDELAKPEQEPVAWMLPEYGDVLSASEADGTGIYNIPLYTAPPRKEWVGLTEHDIELTFLSSGYTAKNFVRAIEAKLKDKNHGSV